jgi:hypothetical protein
MKTRRRGAIRFIHRRNARGRFFYTRAPRPANGRDAGPLARADAPPVLPAGGRIRRLPTERGQHRRVDGRLPSTGPRRHGSHRSLAREPALHRAVLNPTPPRALGRPLCLPHGPPRRARETRRRVHKPSGHSSTLPMSHQVRSGINERASASGVDDR